MSLSFLKLVDSWKVGLQESPKVTYALILVTKLQWEPEVTGFHPNGHFTKPRHLYEKQW